MPNTCETTAVSATTWMKGSEPQPSSAPVLEYKRNAWTLHTELEKQSSSEFGVRVKGRPGLLQELQQVCNSSKFIFCCLLKQEDITMTATQPRMKFITSMIKPRTAPNIRDWTAAEFEAAVKATKKAHFNEVLQGGFTKAYFDSDAYYPECPAASEYKHVFACFQAVLLKLLDGQPGFHPKMLVYGERHGMDPKHPETPYKISFRAWLQGYKVEYPRLSAFILSKQLGGTRDGLLDINVYKASEQLLACMGCSKGSVACKGSFVVDERVLKPVGPAQAIEAYLVQHLTGDEQELVLPPVDVSQPAIGPSAPPRNVQPPAETRLPLEVDAEHVKQVLALLKDTRWDDRGLWVKYGLALWNFGGAGLKDAWKDRSKTYAKYDEQAAEATWASFGKRAFSGTPISFGTICQHAKEDDAAGFARVQAERARHAVANSIAFALKTNGSHVALAKVVHAVLGSAYKATSASKSRAWFHFDGTRWKKHDDGQLMRDITDKVQPVFDERAKQVEAQIAAAAAAEDKERLEKLRAKYAKLANLLLDSTYRASVIREYAPLVQETGFEAKLDNNVNLLGFEDGVFDLAAGVFRPGQPDDYLTKSVGYCYPAEWQGHQADIEQFLSMILPNAEVRDYLLNLLAQKLSGACVKRVCIHTGLGGDNGKTTLFELVLQAMGEYGYKAKIQMFTGKRQDAGRADPDSAMLRGIRFLFGEEPDEGARLNIGLLKDLSGGGAFSFRLLFSNDVVSTIPQFMMHFACNKMPEIDGSDGGGRNRLNKIDYSSKFVDEASEVDEARHWYQKDICIKEKFPAWAPDLMRMLLQRYKHGFVPPVPKSVQASTSSYLDANDEYAVFKKLFVEAGAESDNVTANDVLAKWREYEVDKELCKPPNKVKLIEGLTVVLRTELVKTQMIAGVRRRNAWWGWRLREEPLEDEDEDEEED